MSHKIKKMIAIDLGIILFGRCLGWLDGELYTGAKGGPLVIPAIIFIVAGIAHLVFRFLVCIVQAIRRRLFSG